jgi:hypothetical protein
LRIEETDTSVVRLKTVGKIDFPVVYFTTLLVSGLCMVDLEGSRKAAEVGSSGRYG